MKDGDLFAVGEKHEIISLDAWHTYYQGGDGSSVESPVDYINIEHYISSSHPVYIYVVPSRSEFEAVSRGDMFEYYPRCKKESVLSFKDSCDGLTSYGGIMIQNILIYFLSFI